MRYSVGGASVWRWLWNVVWSGERNAGGEV